MLELTEAEARTLWAILSMPGEREVFRIRASGLSPSTYYAAKRRAYEAGWVADLLVPDPFAYTEGHLRIRLSLNEPLGDPFPDQDDRDALRQRLLGWSGLNVGLYVDALGGPVPTSSPPSSPDRSEVHVGPARGAAPVCLDFSGLWSRFVGVPCPRVYPRGLGGPSLSRRGGRLPSVRPATTRGEEPGVAGASWIAPHALGSTSRRDLRRGRIKLLHLLRPDRLPPYRGRALGLWVFLGGVLHEGRSSAALVAELNRSCGVFPFLAVDDGHTYILGAAGVTSSSTGSRLAVASHPVREVLGRFSSELRSTVEPASTLRSG